MMDDLRDIAQFVEVARARSFSRAAAALGLPPSTLSRRISELEASLGTQLLLRTTRRVDLTEAGALFLSHCAPIIDAARTARAELATLSRRPRGSLRVSLTADFGTTFLAPIIATFCRSYPEIEVHLDLSPRRADLMSDGVDVAFRIGMPQEPYLYTRKLVTAGRGLLASPAYLAEQPAPTSPEELSLHACLFLSGQSGEQRWVLHQDADAREVTVQGQIQANTPGMVLRLAQEGMGIAVADEVMAAPYLQAGLLVRVLPDWVIAPVTIYSVTASRVLPTKTRLFIDHVQAALKRFDADKRAGDR